MKMKMNKKLLSPLRLPIMQYSMDLYHFFVPGHVPSSSPCSVGRPKPPIPPYSAAAAGLTHSLEPVAAVASVTLALFMKACLLVSPSYAHTIPGWWLSGGGVGSPGLLGLPLLPLHHGRCCCCCCCCLTAAAAAAPGQLHFPFRPLLSMVMVRAGTTAGM